ncbi:hypothetical protein EC968_000604 [Mortierella alpina]|nr:hypothetical protein EC968_000604 [Mortierella alpina]
MASTQAEACFTADELEDLKQLFEQHDTDHDGCVNREELKNLILSTGQEIDLEDAEIAIDSVDSNGDGALNYEEFMSLMTELRTRYKD